METYISSKKETWLPWFARGLILLLFIILFARLIELQIIKGVYFKKLSEGNRVRKVTITAPRGKVLARGGETLISNKEIKKRVKFDAIEGYEKSEDISGAEAEEIITEWERYYLLSEEFAHIGGYVGEIDQEELGKVDPKCVDKGPRKLTSVVGRSGLEEYYNCKLTGIDGELLLEVDTTGKIIRLLGRRDPVPGQDLVTNIDYGLQRKLSKFVREKTGVPSSLLPSPEDVNGAGVVTDSNGGVLALFSYPSFDPNVFIKKNKQNEISEVLNSARKPLFNRVIGGTYHPGSVYKPLVLLAALSEGVIDKDYTFVDEGMIEIKTLYGDFSYSNWYFTQYGGVEGEIGARRALARSTDTFFYKVGELLGIEKLVLWSEKFGLNKKTNIDLIGETTGLVPNPNWKEKARGEKWFLGNTYHMAIGQGDLALTLLEINRMITAIANGGKLCDTKIFGETACEDLKLDKNYLSEVTAGMFDVCREGGTGFTFFDFLPKSVDEEKAVACKTGTAETVGNENSHAWFVAFSPTDFPEIVVTVLVENGGEGSKVAGPIAREIFDYWYEKK